MGEKRVALSPDIVKKLSNKGFSIKVTASAGESADFTDDQYRDAGAEIVSPAEALKADILVRVRKPSASEADELPKGSHIGPLLMRHQDPTGSIQ